MTAASTVPVSGTRRVTAARLGAKYAAGLISAHITAAAAVVLVVASLSGNTVGDARNLATTENMIAVAVLVLIAATAGASVGVRITLPTFRWFAEAGEPTPAEQHAAVRMANRQTIVQFATWVVCGTVFVLLNLDIGRGIPYVMGTAVLFGGAMAACLGWLITQRTMRPIIAVAMRSATAETEIPGVLVRLIFIWALFSAIPMTGIALLVLARSNEWFVQESASIEAPILAQAAISLLFSFGAMVLVARSISDPVRAVVIGMKRVERGQSDVTVEVYEPSEIGQLQSGFNRMVTGLAERERLRDLFGRYVGVDVAEHALEHEASLIGDVREVAVLYVDLVGSTTMAASRPPDETARILDDFFRIVVAAVTARHGLINKFAGDAVLAVFGAPLRHDDPSSAALVTARALADELRNIPGIDFGVGVSFGSVFAGNVGAENRFEYTVVGDAVNEAARLADQAKMWPSRVLTSGPALEGAAAGERERWASRGSTVLRGRSTPTQLAEPQ